jgi:hypothetical protein
MNKLLDSTDWTLNIYYLVSNKIIWISLRPILENQARNRFYEATGPKKRNYTPLSDVSLNSCGNDIIPSTLT